MVAAAVRYQEMDFVAPFDESRRKSECPPALTLKAVRAAPSKQ